MKLIFVGSLEKTTPDYSLIREQLRNLVVHLVNNKCEFVVRRSSGEDSEFISIDLVVLESLAEINGSNNTSVKITTFNKVGSPTTPIPAGLIVSNHSDSSDTRAAMYSEINSLVDIVVGVGGRHGLLRHSIACEYTNKPFLPLPGTGGVCDELWADFIRKGKVVLNCSDSDLRLIKNTPLANQDDPDYGRAVLKVIETVKLNAIRIADEEFQRLEKAAQAIDFKKMTISEVIKGIRRLSLGSILMLTGAAGVIYFAGVSTSTYFPVTSQTAAPTSNQQWPNPNKLKP